VLTSGHYQPFFPVAADKDDYEDKNNDNKVENGDAAIHGIFPVRFPRLYRQKIRVSREKAGKLEAESSKLKANTLLAPS
jgi:hypothetical protein